MGLLAPFKRSTVAVIDGVCRDFDDFSVAHTLTADESTALATATCRQNSKCLLHISAVNPSGSAGTQVSISGIVASYDGVNWFNYLVFDTAVDVDDGELSYTEVDNPFDPDIAYLALSVAGFATEFDPVDLTVEFICLQDA